MTLRSILVVALLIDGFDSLGYRLSDPRLGGKHAYVLVLARPGKLTGRPHHRPERLAHAHAIVRAEDLEKLAVDRRQEPDQPGPHPAAHLVPLDVEHRMQR